MGDIRNVEVWNSAMSVAELVYKLTDIGKLAKEYSLKDQMRRAALSIPSNIAEGLETGFDKMGIRYFHIARGSIAELKTQLLLASRIEYISSEDYEDIFKKLDMIGKMLYKLIQYRKSHFA
jgi:four helix bundle protein